MQTVTPSKQLSLMLALTQEGRLATDDCKAVFLYHIKLFQYSSDLRYPSSPAIISSRVLGV